MESNKESQTCRRINDMPEAILNIQCTWNYFPFADKFHPIDYSCTYIRYSYILKLKNYVLWQGQWIASNFDRVTSLQNLSFLAVFQVTCDTLWSFICSFPWRNNSLIDVVYAVSFMQNLDQCCKNSAKLFCMKYWSWWVFHLEQSRCLQWF